MAYDTGLAERIDDFFRGRGIETAPKKMFGGIAYMVQGNMCVGILGDYLMVRVGKDAYEATLAEPGVHQTVGNFRPMKGFLWVDAEAIADDPQLTAWIERALDFARTLPPK